MESLVPVRRVQRVRHELRRRTLTVARVTRPVPGFVEVVLAGPELDGFTSLGFDDHVKCFFPQAAGEPVARDYTPQRFDAARGELVIVFALHGEGPAARWAEQAQPGDTLVVGGPRGSMIVPTDFGWHLLVGDTSALPAIARRLQELPSGAQVFVIAQAGEADRCLLPGHAGTAVRWVDRDEQLIAAVRGLALPDSEGYAWAAGEAAVMARVLDVLVREKGLPKEAMRVAAYWKRGAIAHHQNLDD